MKKLLAVAALCLFAASGAFAQDKNKDGKSDGKSAQQERMRDCNREAADRKLKGDDRKGFMSSCLRGESAKAEPGKRTGQQDRMASCNKQASSKNMKGDDRKKFMSECLKG